MSKPLILAASLLLLLPGTALAEITVAQSVEWLVADADLVVRGRILSFERVVKDGREFSWTVSLVRIDETLRGEAGESIPVLSRDYWPVGEPPKSGEFLLFLGRHGVGSRYPDFHAALERVPYAIRHAVRLDAPIEECTMRMEILTDRDALLGAAREAASFSNRSTERPGSARMEVPPNAPAFASLYGGSAVYVIVPVDERLVGPSDVRRMRNDLQAARRRIADLEKRLASAEERLAGCRPLVERAAAAYDESDPRRTLLLLRLSRLSPGAGDRAVAERLFEYPMVELIRAAHETLWPVTLEERRKGTEWTVDLCAGIEGGVARNVLRLQADNHGTMTYVITTEARLYCFADEEGPHGWKAYYLNRGRVVHDGLGRRGGEIRVTPWDSKGVGYSIHEEMQLPGLKLSRKNAHHWSQNAFGTPIWAAPYVTEDFAKLFPPRSPNREGETDPEPR